MRYLPHIDGICLASILIFIIWARHLVYPPVADWNHLPFSKIEWILQLIFNVYSSENHAREDDDKRMRIVRDCKDWVTAFSLGLRGRVGELYAEGVGGAGEIGEGNLAGDSELVDELSSRGGFWVGGGGEIAVDGV
ncbi:hypothetical protein R3P38DRAFT_2811977 [Favolaschia claudopus]|uniref:Uncharacterized protein n=1 Tax=Favolaschia claudopus TaxID=2862362 RepID=A0AAV9Z8T1_9AGAR